MGRTFSSCSSRWRLVPKRTTTYENATPQRTSETVTADPLRTTATGSETSDDNNKMDRARRLRAWLRLNAVDRACCCAPGTITHRPCDLLLGGVEGAIIFIPLRNRSAAGRGAVCRARIAAGTNTAIQATPKMARNQMVKPCFPV